MNKAECGSVRVAGPDDGIAAAPHESSGFKSFRMGDLFDIMHPMATFNACELDINEAPGIGVHPYVVRKSGDNGVRGYIKASPERLNPGRTISFAQDTAQVFYQPLPYFTGNNMRILRLKERELDRRLGLYLVSCLRRAFSGFSWGQSFADRILSDVKVSLPITEAGVPDWNFMQGRIAKFERAHADALRSYLEAAGLSQPPASDGDQKTLSMLRDEQDAKHHGDPAARKEMRKFKITDLFVMQKGRRLAKAGHLHGNTPFVGSTARDNGVTGYVSQMPIFCGGAITASYNGSVGQAFYQEESFWASDDIIVLRLKGRQLDRQLAWYLCACLRRAGRAFSYAFKWNMERMRGTSLPLPIRTDGENRPLIDPKMKYHPEGFIPDWDFMRACIGAIEKLAIRELKASKEMYIRKAHTLADAEYA